jgi:uncharacterized protein
VTGEVRVLRDAAGIDPRELKDWGPVAEPLGEPVSRTAGVLLHRDGAGHPESGLWECSPGRWRCEVTRAEFCHFLAGSCRYRSDDGETIAIGPGDSAWFPAGWRGECEVLTTVRKVYVVI